MKKFEFRLERAREWRLRKLEIEREKQRMIRAEIDAIDSGIREREAERLKPAPAVMTGQEVAAQQRFLDRLRRELIELASRRQEALKRLAVQNAAVVAADRDVKLLDHLKEKALVRWQHEADKEIEELAGEAYLARWSREMRLAERRENER